MEAKRQSIRYLKRVLLSDTSVNMLGVAFNGFRRLFRCSVDSVDGHPPSIFGLLFACPVTATPLPGLTAVRRDLPSILAHDCIRLFSRSSAMDAGSLLIYGCNFAIALQMI